MPPTGKFYNIPKPYRLFIHLGMSILAFLLICRLKGYYLDDSG